MMSQLIVSGVVTEGGSGTATWWRCVWAFWVGPVVDIQVTEWVNVMRRISSGEKS